MTALTLPTRIDVGPLRYDVSADTDDWERTGNSDRLGDCYGYTDHEEAAILLHPRMSPRMRPLALMHEMLHAVAFTAGQLNDRKRTEEQWVLMVTPLLVDTLRRNPAVTKYLISADPKDTN